ncbi:MAG: Unknown protein [uncultured Thiotrichaceae bacterium]|uniref:Uncharacterized protein n=1 Tax=uncultured Thiotrichaceae bacterium TaxID=298394 RepID=A0A6S6U3T5_9GAMM|nr:MAG: Unknown protein [uncultured Thiotrichaceae bacterium]
MINQTSNNFQVLTGTLCGLNHGQSATANSAFEGISSQTDDPQSFEQEGFNGSFSGFQQNLGQQYSLDNQQTSQLLSLFVQVLSEIMSNVITNSATSAVSNNASIQAQPAMALNTVTTSTSGADSSAIEAAVETATAENATITEEAAPASCPFNG